MKYLITIGLGMTTGQGGDEVHYPIPIPLEKIHPHPHTQIQQVSNFYPILIPPGNGYNLVPIPVPVFLLLQY